MPLKVNLTWRPTWRWLALFPLLLTGCASPQTTAAHKIADALPRALGPARRYDVHVEGDTFALARGHARRIHIVGEDVTVAPNITLDTLDIDARGVSFDPRSQRLTHVDQATFTGTVGQENLDRFIGTHHQALPGLVVSLRDTDAAAELPINVPGLHTEATVSGALSPDTREPDHLDFIADGASVGALPIPAGLVNAALRLVNPVFDLAQIKIPVTVTQVIIVHGQIVLQGTANLNGLHPL